MSGQLYALYVDLMRVFGELAQETCECGAKYREDADDVSNHADNCPYCKAALGEG